MQGSLNEQMELPNPGGGEMPRIIRLQPDRKGGGSPPTPPLLSATVVTINWVGLCPIFNCYSFVIHSKMYAT